VAVPDREIPVLVVDREALICEGMAAVLGRDPGISVVATTVTPDQALAAVQRDTPSVLVIGHEPPWLDGIALLRRVSRSAGSPLGVLVLNDSFMDRTVQPALRFGARGMLCRDEAPSMLASTVRAVAAGVTVIAPVAQRHLVTRLAELPEPGDHEEVEGILSGRELEVLRLVARGMNNQEIARKLCLSVATIKSHLYSICRKEDLRDRSQVVILAYEMGIIRPDHTRPGNGDGNEERKDHARNVEVAVGRGAELA
jgi:DNA-binding NarL/FixJ family response regulator